jgi:hypothetical protein
MTKYEAIHAFFASFGLPAYDEASVPTWTDDELTQGNVPPYITYHAAVSHFYGLPAAVICNVWDVSDSWALVDAKADEIGLSVGGFRRLVCDEGYIVVTRGDPFAQRYADGPFKRQYINLVFTFITN